jgi:hypothetical protein
MCGPCAEPTLEHLKHLHQQQHRINTPYHPEPESTCQSTNPYNNDQSLVQAPNFSACQARPIAMHQVTKEECQSRETGRKRRAHNAGHKLADKASSTKPCRDEPTANCQLHRWNMTCGTLSTGTRRPVALVVVEEYF